MLKVFPIDFIRQIFEQVLLIEKNKDPHLFGGDNEINIFSFYEHLQSDAEVDRYVETFRDLTEQQNRTGLIGNAVLTAPSNPSITNLNQGLIIPLEYTFQVRTTMANRDAMLGTLYNLIEKLKGRKVDIAQLDTGKLFMVGTIGVNEGMPIIKFGDYIGEKPYDPNETVDTFIDNRLTEITADDVITFTQETGTPWLYFGKVSSTGNIKLCVAQYDDDNDAWVEIEDSGDNPNIIFPPEHTNFEKYQVSISFESVRCDEPRTLNAEEYCMVAFGGSATIVSNGITLGNELVKVLIKKLKIIAKPVIEFDDAPIYVLDPLELPSGNDINTMANQLVSNNFKTNSHADAVNLTIQYNFIVDKNIAILKQWFNYARYGHVGITADDISPNMIYLIGELWSCWGDVNFIDFNAKIIENIEIENTESDVLSLGLTFQVQGENN